MEPELKGPGPAKPKEGSQVSGARREWAVTGEPGHVRTVWEAVRVRVRAGSSELTPGPCGYVPSPRCQLSHTRKGLAP